MCWKNLLVRISLVVFLFSAGWAVADCPSADLTGDCFVDFEDFALMANQWLTSDPNIPDDMTYIPYGGFEMGGHFAEGSSNELPLHAVLIDAFFMSRYEITNQQYCDYLNSAYPAQLKVVSGIVYASSDSGNSYPYCDTHSYDTDSQIDYSAGVFSVRNKGVRDMSDDPMVEVSWYGAVAYCNWRSSEEGYESCYNLSTWDCNFAKHGYHSDWDDGIYPYTAPCGSFSANGHGLYDMAGNVWEWCNDWYDGNYYDVSPYDNPQGPVSGSYRVLRGGSWATMRTSAGLHSASTATRSIGTTATGFALSWT